MSLREPECLAMRTSSVLERALIRSCASLRELDFLCVEEGLDKVLLELELG